MVKRLLAMQIMGVRFPSLAPRKYEVASKSWRYGILTIRSNEGSYFYL